MAVPEENLLFEVVDNNFPSAPSFVLKRNGQKVPFDADKIVLAIKNAGIETGEFSEDEARHLAFKVVKVLKYSFADSTPDIEQIQDIIEQVLINDNYTKTAKQYIIYRQKKGEARADKKIRERDLDRQFRL